MFRRVLAGAAALTMVAAACGSSKSKTTSASTATTASGGTGGTVANSGAPVKIAVLDFETGVYATPDRHNAIDLAVEQLNAKGGIAGHHVEYSTYDTGILPATTVTAVTKAISDKPTFMIGLSVSSGVLASAALLKAAGIPTIQQGQDNTTDLSKLGVNSLFRGQPSAKQQGDAAINFIASLKPTTVGLWDDSDLNGVQTQTNVKAGLKAKGITNFIYREVPQNATDATEAAIAMKGADIITSDGFPNEEAIFVKDLALNGVKAKDLMGNSGTSIASFAMAPWTAIAGDYSYNVCDPDALQTSVSTSFGTAYKAKFASTTQLATSGANLYDSIMMMAKAIESEKGSLAPADIVKGLETVSYDGVCGTYKSDAEHNLSHTMYIIQFGQVQGQVTKVAQYDNMASS